MTGIEIYTHEGRIAIHTHEPGTCQTCGTLHYFWRSVGGRVVCAGCAPAVEREWAERVAA